MVNSNVVAGSIVQVFGTSTFGITLGVVSKIQADEITVDRTIEFSRKKRKPKGMITVDRADISRMDKNSIADLPLIKAAGFTH